MFKITKNLDKAKVEFFKLYKDIKFNRVFGETTRKSSTF